jgi:hypothetical protein
MAQRWHGEESRWGDRVRVNIPVQVSADACSRTDGNIANLSLSGALLRANINLGLHSLVEVKIPLPPPSRCTEAVNAYVSRKLENGVGLEWCDFAPAIVKDLLRSSSMMPPS